MNSTPSDNGAPDAAPPDAPDAAPGGLPSDKRISVRRMGDTIAMAVERSDIPLGLLMEGKITYANAAFADEYGDYTGKSYSDFFGGEHMEQLEWLIANACGDVDKILLTLRDDLDSPHAGSKVMVQIWPLIGELILFSMRRDYSVHRLADLDELTHLPNRRKAKMLLDIERERAGEDSIGFCLTMGDIDHFKAVNDTHGHDVGDEVLKHVAQMISSALREGDWVARWGGEEFLILTSNSDIVTGMQPIERVRKKLEDTPFAGVSGGMAVTMSFGIVSSQSGKDLGDMLHKADLLLYEAKNNGRNRIEFESEGGIIWVATQITKVIAEGGLQASGIPVRNWKGKASLGKIVPCLRGGKYSETARMLAAADRLRERLEVDKAIIRQLMDAPALIGGDGAGHFFPLHKNMLTYCGEEVVAFLRAFPRVQIGINAVAPLTEKEMGAVAELGRTLVLYNYNAGQTASHLLGMNGLGSVLFANADNTAGVLSLLHGVGTRCYIQLPAGTSPEDRDKMAESGFDGYMEPPCGDEELSAAGAQAQNGA